MSINPDFTHSIASRPLHQYQRFQDLLKAVFRIELLLPNPEKFIRVVQNFNEYINSFHLENSKEIALNHANSHLTHLALAYDSGFKSTSVFHAFFKKRWDDTESLGEV